MHVFVYKDLGRGEDAYDPKWIAALRGLIATGIRATLEGLRSRFK
jgi:hypothetical protein